MHDKLDHDAAPRHGADAPGRLPRHVGLIMDGNGRWAAARGLPRLEGHRRGVEAVRRAVRAALELKIDVLTVYSFSTENWTRPPQEVAYLMGLLKRFIRNDLADLHRNGVRVRIIGSRDGVGEDLMRLLTEAQELTRDNNALTLCVAFNYGARQEIAAGVQRLARQVAAGRLDPAAITPERIAAELDTAGLPDPDLIIRTSGEQRLSNFLLWQAAYAEFVFLPIHWPDFDRAAFEAALAEYAARDRRFGGIGVAGAKTGS
jgi:undecaprenyl diphosphate synthase